MLIKLTLLTDALIIRVFAGGVVFYGNKSIQTAGPDVVSASGRAVSRRGHHAGWLAAGGFFAGR